MLSSLITVEAFESFKFHLRGFSHLFCFFLKSKLYRLNSTYVDLVISEKALEVTGMTCLNSTYVDLVSLGFFPLFFNAFSTGFCLSPFIFYFFFWLYFISSKPFIFSSFFFCQSVIIFRAL